MAGPDAFDLSYPEEEAALAAAKTYEALEAALLRVRDLTNSMLIPERYGRKLFCPGLDRLVPVIAGRMRLQAVPPPRSNDNVCVIATQFYESGGHTEVTRDIVRDLGADKPVVVVTGANQGAATYRGLLNYPQLTSPMGERALIALQSKPMVEKILELHMLLLAMRPTRVMLMCHPFDVVAILGAWAFRDVCDFVHHADHVPTLGVTLQWGVHADLTFTCHQACLDRDIGAAYAGMTSAGAGAAALERPDAQPGRVTFATCGYMRKFTGEGRHRWVDYAAAALRLPGASFVHVGPVSAEFQASVREGLVAAGLDPARYVFAGLKPLSEALAEHAVDIYVGSYPFGGGKSNLEAMLAGLPMIAPADPDLAPLLKFNLPLSGFIPVESPDEIAAAVAEAQALAPTLRSAAQAARRAEEIGRFERFVAGERPQPLRAQS